jgi:predicted nucleic acid-binding protein
VPPLAFLDANVLYSRTLRDWICQLSLSDEEPFRVCWTEDVLAEMLYHLRRDHPELTEQATGGIRRRLEEYFPEGIVTGYDPARVPAPSDTNDWHVVAAAVEARAAYLVTCDQELLAERGKYEQHLDMLHADDFLVLQLDTHPRLVDSRLKDQIAYLMVRYANDTYAQLRERALGQLEKAEATIFAGRLRGRDALP